jgi:hypothetical protein
MVKFEAVSRHLSEITEEYHEESQYSGRCSGRDLNQAFPEGISDEITH